jgi:2-polyprenyl-3-methyl-5-hydroxy-6-metoxy-1,4-benzoquinol methylase
MKRRLESLEDRTTFQESKDRPGFWRRLERSIRKRRKRFFALIGIDKNKKRFNRVEILLEGLSKNQRGLEIGPSFSPLAAKKDGFNVKILDHATAEELAAKYKTHGVDISKIETVDFVWKGERFEKLVNGEKFDWILASHVIEHTTDLIGFLRDCEAILQKNGELRLAIPDKNFCFDHDRECTSLGRVIDIFEIGPRIQTVGSVAEYYLQVCKKNGKISWDKRTQGVITKVHSLEEVKNAILETKKGKYLDIHNWVFEPHSFTKIFENISLLNYTSLKIKRIIPTLGHEFFVFFKK